MKTRLQNFISFTDNYITIPDSAACIFGAMTNELLPEELDRLSMPELFDLLVTTTQELLDLMNHKKEETHLLPQKKAAVELVQAAISKKKSERNS